MNIITLLNNNRHTTGAGVAYLFAKGAAQVGALWFPNHAAQFKGTAEVIEALAVSYGLMAAGDASKSVTKTEADTQFVRKEDLPASAQSTTPKP